MSKPILVLDVDGVLADFVGATLDFLERNYAVYVDYADLKLWDFMEHPVLQPYRKVAKGHWATPGFAANLVPMKGTVEAVRRLRELTDLRYATSPMGSNPTWIVERNAWLNRHFGPTLNENIRHTSTKSEMKGHIFCDDKIENVVEYRQAHPGAVVILHTQPYNVESAWDGPRVSHVAELIPIVETLWKT